MESLNILHINIKGTFKANHSPYLFGIIQPHTIWSFLNLLYNFNSLKENKRLDKKDKFDLPFMYITSNEEFFYSRRRTVENLKEDNSVLVNIDGNQIKIKKAKTGTGLANDKIYQEIDILVLSKGNNEKFFNLLANIKTGKINKFNIKFAGKQFPEVDINFNILTKDVLKKETEDIGLEIDSDFIKYLIKNFGKKKLIFKTDVLPSSFDIKEYIDYLGKEKEEIKKLKTNLIPILNGYKIEKIEDKYITDHILDLAFVKRIKQISQKEDDLINFYDIMPLIKINDSAEKISFDFNTLEEFL